jgi:hypothetical protein
LPIPLVRRDAAMPEGSKSIKRGKDPYPKVRFTVRLPLALLQRLRRWAARKEVPVSTAVEEAVSRLSDELKAERKKMFQKPKVGRKGQ